MSTISTTTAHGFSPKQRLLDTIAKQVSAGSINASDQTALDAGVQAIDDSLQSGASSGGSGRTARLDPSQMKSRIDDLIGAQVESGNLTSSQAETLKQVFAQGAGHGGHGGHGAAIGWPGGPPPGPPPADDASDGTDDAETGGTTASGSPSGAAGTSAATDSDDVSSLLSSFIKQLQDVQSRLGSYSASGQTGANRTASAMLVNFEA